MQTFPTRAARFAYLAGNARARRDKHMLSARTSGHPGCFVDMARWANWQYLDNIRLVREFAQKEI